MAPWKKVKYFFFKNSTFLWHIILKYRVADKFLARPGRKQATATEDFHFHISYL